MNRFLTTSAIAGFGLATSVAVAMADVIIANETGFDFFTVGAYGGLIPIGSIVCGFLAASGYYIGSRMFQVRPTILLLFQMVLIAALAQGIMYFLEYFLSVKGAIKGMADFIAYLQHDLTSAVYSVGRRGQRAQVAVGQMGYLIAGLHFLGFLAGAIMLFFSLRALPVCRECDMYLDRLGAKEKKFASLDAIEHFHNETRLLPLDSQQYKDMVQAPDMYTGDSGYTLELELLKCPGCQKDTLMQKVTRTVRGRTFAQPEFSRNVVVPEGTDLLPVIKGLI